MIIEDKLKMLGYSVIEEFGFKIYKKPDDSTYIFITPNGEVETRKWDTKMKIRKYEYFIKVTGFLGSSEDTMVSIALMPSIGLLELKGKDYVAENREIQLFYTELILRIYNKITKQKYQFKMDRLCRLSGELHNVSNNKWIIGNTLIDLDNGDYYIFNDDERYYKSDTYIILNCSSVLKYNRKNGDFKKFVVNSKIIFGSELSIYIDIKSGSLSTIVSCLNYKNHVQATISELITGKRKEVILNTYKITAIPSDYECSVSIQ